ncbi:efflux RND transporter periplasmic adaptor subunit [Sulfurimonas lithotrophica]|uniref:Efflux RND transporter periplasmic adaptor subunit n=1 Tax=Sulfurimonas lithotrophica TaxID=2590022 RepID=A0A5P8NYZ7_9BACT|nr:efflux RND transporter periplasmic adaptor subunit [Sulfurimonas lithotrophica]QFR48673.1 efflux RND transporter periplasmic adaptor subunit [Sulfurimonas lithotrophica]
MKNQKRILVLSILLIIMPVYILAAEEKKAMPAPKADIYIVPEAKDIQIDLKYPAQIKSFKNVKVYSRALGILEKKLFKEGQIVQQGDLLYKIEDKLYEAKVQAAKASVEMNQAVLNNATRNWERISKLYKSKSVSDEQRDEALSEYENALSALALAKAHLKQAQIDLDYTSVKAPITGVVGLKKVDIGNLVTNEPPSELVSITQNDKVYIDFSMPMRDYENIKNNLWSIPENGKIQVAINLDGKELPQIGVVDFIDVNINQATSTLKMRAIVENPENTLMPGNFIRVALRGILQKNVITIPQKALLQNPMGTIVFVVEEGKAAVRPVIAGRESNDKYIVAGGMLKSGDKVIVNNFFRVKPGQPLTVDKIINK